MVAASVDELSRAATHGAVVGRTRLAIVGTIFGASGVAALIYQVSWQRILALHSGVGVYSVAIIVAAFLAGLGIGSYAGGRISTRVGNRSALRTFALLELGIATFAVASPFLYYDLLYLRWPALFSTALRAAPIHFMLLLPPTVLMGMSLPFLARAAVTDPRTAARTLGYLYGINVLGAALGALAAPWLLVRLLGVQGAILVGAALNVAAGVVALALVRGSATARTSSRTAGGPPDSGLEAAGSRPFRLWLALYTLSGFIALSLEILWFRVIDVAVKSTAFTFGTVLAVFLLGLGTGSLVGGPLAVTLPRPLRTFLVCQCILLGWAGASMVALVWAPAGAPGMAGLVEFWGQYAEFPLGRVHDWPTVMKLYGAIPLWLYGLPTLLMGISFAVLQRAVQDDARTTGLKVGVLQAGNIAGNVAGSLVTGLVLLDLFGTPGALRILLAVGLVFPVLGIREYGWRGIFPAMGIVLLLLVLLMPSGPRLWMRLHGLSDGVALFSEDATGLAAVTPDTEGRLRVSVDGKGHSWIPYGGIHSVLGAVPAAMHPDPGEVAIIGLGSGDTTWASAFREETERVTVYEIKSGMRPLLQRVAGEGRWPALRRLLDDPRIRVAIADGRAALATGAQRYDIIEADALRPHSAYSGNLYSVEFFRLCASRLRPGGLMCTWSPTRRVYLSFGQAFPHVVEMAGGAILVGSHEPIDFDIETWTARLRSRRALDYLGPAVPDETVGALQSARPGAPELHLGVGVNHDLFPRDEFLSPGPR